MPSLIRIWRLLRKVPRPVVGIILDVVKGIAESPNQEEAAWRARKAVHESLTDEILRGMHPK